MKYTYNIFFVPNMTDRKIISKQRTLACKKTHSTQALQYPVHISLISGGFTTNNYKELEQELRALCKEQSPIKLQCEEKTVVIPERFWTGIHIQRMKKVKKFQEKLQELRNKYADEKQTHHYRPLHITYSYPAIVKHVKPEKSPVRTLAINHITIVRKKTGENNKYTIHKHIPLKKKRKKRIQNRTDNQQLIQRNKSKAPQVKKKC
jgi:hypothetical protein